jgi:hypothetical protein
MRGVTPPTTRCLWRTVKVSCYMDFVDHFIFRKKEMFQKLYMFHLQVTEWGGGQLSLVRQKQLFSVNEQRASMNSHYTCIQTQSNAPPFVTFFIQGSFQLLKITHTQRRSTRANNQNSLPAHKLWTLQKLQSRIQFHFIWLDNLNFFKGKK